MMSRKTQILILLLAAVSASATLSTQIRAEKDHEHEIMENHVHEHDIAHREEASRGPHGGRLLGTNDFALEIAIYEAGVPPEFHVYAYSNNILLPPDDVNLHIELERLGNRIDRISFSPLEDYLRGQNTVHEPHSFNVTVIAQYRGQDYQWQYENFEGRTRIPPIIAKEAGIATETAGPVTLRETLTLSGRVRTDPDRVSRVRARFPGVIQSLHKSLGDVVQAGDALATVQSNESMQNYTITAPIDGLIVVRDAQVGEATGEGPMFVITDLSNVWIELDVFGRDLSRVHAGQSVEIQTFDGYRVDGVIDWVSPLAAHASQSVSARVRLPNPDGKLRPGQFAQGRVTIAEHKVTLAVRQSALQRFRDHPVVFVRFGDTYEVRMLETGRHNREWIEVLNGLEPGSEYVTANSFLIKADVEKAGASHDH